MSNSSPRRRKAQPSYNKSNEVAPYLADEDIASGTSQTVDISAISLNKAVEPSTRDSKAASTKSNTSENKSTKGSLSSLRSRSHSNQNGSSENFVKSSFNSDGLPSQGIALGMIETRGMVPAIEAADAMTKAAEVNLVSRDFVGGGYVSVMVRGETGAVNASVRAGADACERVGDGLVAAHIIARPHSEVEPVLTASKRVRGG